MNSVRCLRPLGITIIIIIDKCMPVQRNHDYCARNRMRPPQTLRHVLTDSNSERAPYTYHLQLATNRTGKCHLVFMLDCYNPVHGPSGFSLFGFRAFRPSNSPVSRFHRNTICSATSLLPRGTICPPCMCSSIVYSVVWVEDQNKVLAASNQSARVP